MKQKAIPTKLELTIQSLAELEKDDLLFLAAFQLAFVATATKKNSLLASMVLDEINAKFGPEKMERAMILFVRAATRPIELDRERTERN